MAFPTGWNKRHTITIDYTKVGGTSNLSNFPVLLTEANFLAGAFSSSKSDGSDLRFTTDSAGTTEIPFEIVKWDTGNSKAIVWVKIPTLSYTANTVIYVWYGNSGATAYAETDTYGARAVWNSSYKGVWHLSESSGVRYDSTGNNNDLTDNNTVASSTSGKVGTCADFELDNSESLSIADASVTGLEMSGAGGFSIRTWIKIESQILTDQTVVGLVGKYLATGDKRNYLLSLLSENFDTTGNAECYSIYCRYTSDGTFTNSTATLFYTAQNTFTSTDIGVWKQITAIVDVANKSLTLLVNNSSVSNTLDATYRGATTVADKDCAFALGAGNGGTAQYFDGLMDETQVYAGLMTTGWATTAYNNENAPNTFSTGSDETTLSTTTSQTQVGKAKITATTSKTQLGKSRITASTSRTQAGKARLTVTTGRTQTGKGRVQITTPRTQAGKSRMEVTTGKTQTGVSLIAEAGVTTTNRNQTGKSRVEVTTTRTQVGKAAIQLQQNRNQTGKAMIQIVTQNRTQTGKADIKATTGRTQTGKATIRLQQNRTQTGKAKIIYLQTKTQTGKARVQKTETHNQTGKALIMNYSYKYTSRGSVWVDKTIL